MQIYKIIRSCIIQVRIIYCFLRETTRIIPLTSDIIPHPSAIVHATDPVLWHLYLTPTSGTFGRHPKTLPNFNPSNTQSVPHTHRPYVCKHKHLFPSAPS